ncbi:hypothetical protein RHECNPAF_1740065 [Rhizobium etli CNPAF512]|nr:hypothetical protein RHECNPAF_1740065 [Rhizobium etli CNPAF512]
MAVMANLLCDRHEIAPWRLPKPPVSCACYCLSRSPLQNARHANSSTFEGNAALLPHQVSLGRGWHCLVSRADGVTDTGVCAVNGFSCPPHPPYARP